MASKLTPQLARLTLAVRAAAGAVERMDCTCLDSVYVPYRVARIGTLIFVSAWACTACGARVARRG